MENLRALIYFTDGDGIYPRQKPDYETAFVFLERSEKMKLVPDWALCLITRAEGEKMNIQEAKKEICHTLKAYLMKDEHGDI